MAYKLAQCDSGKPYRRLVSADCLKPYVDRTELDKRLRLLAQSQVAKPEQNRKKDRGNKTDDAATTDIPKDYELATKVLKERVRAGQKKYLVQFVTGSRAWCDQITDPLLQSWRVTQQ